MQSVEVADQQVINDKWHLEKNFATTTSCENYMYCIENGINGMASLFPLSAYFRFRNDEKLPETLLINKAFKWTTLEELLTANSSYSELFQNFSATTPILLVQPNTVTENTVVIEFPCSIKYDAEYQNYGVIIGENSSVQFVETLNFNHINADFSGQKPQSALWLIKKSSNISRSRAYTTCCSTNNESKIVIEENAKFYSTILKIGKGDFYKTIQNIDLIGENSSAEYKECFIGESNQCAETHIRVSHLAANTYSGVDVRSILTAESKFAFDGNVFIDQNADNSTSSQNNSNFVFSENATAISVPNMDINNKNVKASHSAGSKHIDQSLIFYAQTRGLSEKASQKLLLHGFISSILDKTPETLTSVCLDRLDTVIT